MHTTETEAERDIFEDIIRLHEALRLAPLTTMPQGWRQVLPNGWHFVVNGNETPLDVEMLDMMPLTVQPFHAVFWYRGWIAGDVLPMAGGWLADGEGANATTLHAAFEQAIAEAGVL